MKTKLFQNDIYVKRSKTHGFGVFAGKTIRKGALIEECYMVLSDGGDDVLDDYYFDANGGYALFTGFGSIYNHSDDPSADYKLNLKTRIATITAERTIQKGEEIFVSYGEEWFTSRDLKPKKVRSKKKRKAR